MGSERYESIRNIKRAIKRYAVSGLKLIEKELNNAEKELEKESIKMYDSYIRQYYRYKTKVYSRHVTGVGTRTGWNLYQAKDFNLSTDIIDKYSDYHTLGFNNLDIQFNADNMIDDNYEDITKEEVLDLVLNGSRAFQSWEWSGSYKGKYFSYKGTMADAFKEFKKEHSNLIDKICGDKIDKKIDKLYKRVDEVMDRNLDKIF